jgi:hypothetical protein
MAAQEIAYLSFGGIRPLTKVMIERHQNPRGTEAALQRVMALESLLQNAEPIGSGRQTFHRADVAAVDLHREREASTGDHSVHGHGAGPANAVLASDMRAGGADLVTQKIRQQHAGFRFAADDCAVQVEPDLVSLV